MPLEGQLGNQRCVPSGPLVLGRAPLKPPAPVADRDRTVSRRSEPSSRAALMGEQPNPWDLLQPQDATSRHRGAKPPRRCGRSGRSACYPRGNFYPLIDGPSTRDHRFTRPGFRPCSACRPRSQAPFYPCALRRISVPPEGTFGRLRYLLGGDRPSQTARQALSPHPRVRPPAAPGWYFTGASPTRRRGFTGSHLSYAGATKSQHQAAVKLHGVFSSCHG